MDAVEFAEWMIVLGTGIWFLGMLVIVSYVALTLSASTRRVKPPPQN